jgi:hypothetical protein
VHEATAHDYHRLLGARCLPLAIVAVVCIVYLLLIITAPVLVLVLAVDAAQVKPSPRE